MTNDEDQQPASNEDQQAAADKEKQGAALKIPDEVFKEAVADYYKGVFGLADTARGRSQAAWAIASAIAAALVAAGLIKNLSDADVAVQALASSSIFLWLATGVVFMWALVKPLPSSPPTVTGPREAAKVSFVTSALNFFRDDLNGVQFRQRVALWVTASAAAVTVAAVVVAFTVQKPTPIVSATVALSDEGQQTVNALCGATQLDHVSGTLETETLKHDNVVIQVPESECPGIDPAKTKGSSNLLVIPRKQIVGVETDDEDVVIPT
jgi:hypothetical protein